MGNSICFWVRKVDRRPLADKVAIWKWNDRLQRALLIPGSGLVFILILNNFRTHEHPWWKVATFWLAAKNKLGGLIITFEHGIEVPLAHRDVASGRAVALDLLHLYDLELFLVYNIVITLEKFAWLDIGRNIQISVFEFSGHARRGWGSDSWYGRQNFGLEKFVLLHVPLVILHLEQVFASWVLGCIINLNFGLIVGTWLSRADVGVKKILHASFFY